jgi:hypothetical protein
MQDEYVIGCFREYGERTGFVAIVLPNHHSLMPESPCDSISGTTRFVVEDHIMGNENSIVRVDRASR